MFNIKYFHHYFLRILKGTIISLNFVCDISIGNCRLNIDMNIKLLLHQRFFDSDLLNQELFSLDSRLQFHVHLI